MPAARGTGTDFADFLLGVQQQASLQVGQTSQLRQRSVDAYIEDNWQKSSKLTFNLGLRYELALPYVEVNGRMANLDAAPGFASVSPVTPGATGPFTGVFPAGLLNRDANNLGPRLGFAYRLRPQTIVRGGYSITYNSGSYASIARELVGQPPFAETETVTGATDTPLTLAEALIAPAPATTNNWGVDRDYELGMIQTWNASVTRNLTQDWMLQATYTGIKGTDLDTLRAPALGPGGVLIPGVQAFIWESSGGHSIMNAGNLQLRRRLAHGVSGGFSYTLAKAMDNASSLGAGGAVVAQDDKYLAAEWAPSTFDRRQQLAGNVYVELPWGPNRRWLNNGGTLAQLFGEWSAQFNLIWQTGTPLTARVLGAASDLLRGVNGSLRANYNGTPIELSDPTVDEFFNITAFSTPRQAVWHLDEKYDRRPGQPSVERAFPTRSPNWWKPGDDASTECPQSAQHRSMGSRRYELQFANLRPGDCCAADADDDGHREVQVLVDRQMRRWTVGLIAAAGFVATASLFAQQSATPQPPQPIFRSGLNLVLVDVVVRDKSAAVVRGLTAADFELLEDGVRQKIVTIAYEEIKPGAAPIENASALAGASPDNRPAVAVGGSSAHKIDPAGVDQPSHPLTSDETAGHRLVTLVFDTSSMEPDNVQKAVDAANHRRSPERKNCRQAGSILQGSATTGGSRRRRRRRGRHAAISTLSAAHGTASDAVDASTAPPTTRCNRPTTLRAWTRALRNWIRSTTMFVCALKTLAEALQPIQQKKALIYSAQAWSGAEPTIKSSCVPR